VADSLKSKTIRALSWSLIETIGVQGVRFIIGIVLARLLFPQQFGLIGMLMIFIYVSQSFFDSGFGAALIQKRDVTPIDLCSIFYFNIVVGAAGAGLLCLAAPLIAAFYKEPALISLMRALSLTIVINSFGLIQNAIFTRQLNFKILTKVSLISSVLSGSIGIVLAATGFGVWSLAAQQVSAAFLSTLCLWLFSPWRPSAIFSFRVLREMFGFGSRLLASELLNRIFINIYSLVIGKLFAAANLGYFTRAQSIQEVPTNTLAGMVSRVTFPVFSSIQDNPAQLKRGVKKALTTLVLINFPMMIGLAIVARPLVLLILTEKWAPCIPYLQLFCLAGLMYPLQVINLNVLIALGRSGTFLRLEIIKKVLAVINIAVTWRWGISAMIDGMIVMSVIGYYLNSYYTGVLIGYSIWEQVRDLLSYLLTAMVMGVTVVAFGQIRFPSLGIMLSVQIAAGITVYVGLCGLFRLAAFVELLQMARKRWPFFKAAARKGKDLR
jgi:teichuronic acid exporter